jgi:hypothetical protein
MVLLSSVVICRANYLVCVGELRSTDAQTVSLRRMNSIQRARNLTVLRLQKDPQSLRLPVLSSCKKIRLGRLPKQVHESVSVQLWRSGGIGIGTLYVCAPTPTPPSQVFGGVVQTRRVAGHSAAQNM